MNWPATRAELRKAGWQETVSTKKCSCGVDMFWFITPAKKWIPLSFVKGLAPVVKLEPHHASCKNVKDFKSANKKHADRTDLPKPEQRRLF